MPGKTPEDEDDRDRGVYGISVTAGLVGTSVANLRAYERAGLLQPARTAGGTRLYSPHDVARLRRITELLGAGVNLTGIAMVLDLQDDNHQLRGNRGTDVSPVPRTR